MYSSIMMHNRELSDELSQLTRELATSSNGGGYKCSPTSISLQPPALPYREVEQELVVGCISLMSKAAGPMPIMRMV